MDIAVHYNKQSEYTLTTGQIRYIEKIKQFVLDKEYKNRTLLDIGIGRGYIAIEMAKLGLKKVIATDVDPEAINRLQEYKVQFKLHNLELIECKAEEIPLDDNSADYVVANGILEHTSNEKRAINEWKRILKKNGKMLITVPLTLEYMWPFFWPFNKWQDIKIRRVQRYDVFDLANKFNLPIIHYFYIGHLVKVVGMLFSAITKDTNYDPFFEKLDKKKEHIRYGASNVSVVFVNAER